MGYNFTAEWVKGTLNNAPDALSRNPVSDPQQSEMIAERDTDNNPENTLLEVRAIANEHQENVRLQDLRKQAEEDHEYQQLQHYIIIGFPEHQSQLPDECKRYWNIRNQLAIDDNLIVHDCRLLIPSKMRHDVLT